MDDHFDIGRVFEIGKFDITRLTCIYNFTIKNFVLLMAWNVYISIESVNKYIMSFNSPKLLAATRHLLIPFANSLDPGQDRQNVGPDLGPNHLTL